MEVEFVIWLFFSDLKHLNLLFFLSEWADELIIVHSLLAEVTFSSCHVRLVTPKRVKLFICLANRHFAFFDNDRTSFALWTTLWIGIISLVVQPLCDLSFKLLVELLRGLLIGYCFTELHLWLLNHHTAISSDPPITIPESGSPDLWFLLPPVASTSSVIRLSSVPGASPLGSFRFWLTVHHDVPSICLRAKVWLVIGSFVKLGSLTTVDNLS